jgi:hypothetical protein
VRDSAKNVLVLSATELKNMIFKTKTLLSRVKIQNSKNLPRPIEPIEVNIEAI